jgi:MYXO-CTERM domain-containing protein
LQTAVGTSYTDAELKIVKMLFDQRRATNGSQAAKLDMASQALANLDLKTACGILGCTVPVHTGTGGGGATGAGGSKGTAGAPASGGSPAMGGAPGTGTAGAPAAGGTTGSTGGHAGATAAGGSKPSGGGAPPISGAGAGNSTDTAGDGSSSSGKCSVANPGATRPSSWLLGIGALALATLRRRRRVSTLVG